MQQRGCNQFMLSCLSQIYIYVYLSYIDVWNLCIIALILTRNCSTRKRLLSWKGIYAYTFPCLSYLSMESLYYSINIDFGTRNYPRRSTRKRLFWWKGVCLHQVYESNQNSRFRSVRHVIDTHENRVPFCCEHIKLPFKDVV